MSEGARLWLRLEKARVCALEDGGLMVEPTSRSLFFVYIYAVARFILVVAWNGCRGAVRLCLGRP